MPSGKILEEGDTTRFINHNGMERSYLLHIPDDFNPNQSTPVVLIFHGFGLSGEEMVRITGFN